MYSPAPAYRLPPPSSASVERHPFVTAKEALSQPEPWLLAIAMAT
ncbi:MAG: hypothetical protein M5R42_01595 [Rhodocyclaceae bacterium]|nr:hypothetical protein [Rhodocyclaceae bacterium]